MKKKLDSLENHNRVSSIIAHANRKNVPNGIACPDCSHELNDLDRSFVLTSKPPQLAIICPVCSWAGHRVK